MRADDDAQDRTDLLAGFPAEAEWLRLPPPPIDLRFVEATLSRVLADRDSGAWEAAEVVEREVAEAPEGVDEFAAAFANDAALDATVFPAAALAAYAPPPTSAGFVDRTVAAVQRELVAHWQTLLSRYVAPEPGREFVAKTLRALQHDRRPRPLLRAVRSPSVWLGVAAAVLLSTFFLRSPSARPAEAELVAAPAFAAWGRSHSPLPALHVLARADEPGESDVVGDPPDAVELWLATEEDR